jgi:preprotein translocase subunit SecD
MFGTGIIRGFAVTLSVGVFISMFTAVVVTRNYMRLIVRNDSLSNKPGLFIPFITHNKDN